MLTTILQEIKHSMIEPMKAKQTFQQSEIQDGDIICFQRTLNESEYVSCFRKFLHAMLTILESLRLSYTVMRGSTTITFSTG